MAYLIDRQRALLADDIVAIVHSERRQARSRLVLRDNSLCQTLTRPGTFIRCAAERPSAIVQVGAKPPRRTPP